MDTINCSTADMADATGESMENKTIAESIKEMRTLAQTFTVKKNLIREMIRDEATQLFKTNVIPNLSECLALFVKGAEVSAQVEPATDPTRVAYILTSDHGDRICFYLKPCVIGTCFFNHKDREPDEQERYGENGMSLIKEILTDDRFVHWREKAMQLDDEAKMLESIIKSVKDPVGSK